MIEHRKLAHSYLKEKAFIKFHADTARMIGGTNNDAILLKFLIDRDHHYNTNDGWFYLTEEKREENTNITARQQREIIKRLKEKKIIDVERKGIPAKMHFFINYENYHTQLLAYVSTSSNKMSQLDSTKRDNYLIDSKEIDNNIILSKDSNKDFSNPTSFLESSSDKTSYKRKSSKKTKEQSIIKVKLPFLLKEWRTFPQIPKSQHHPKENSKIHQQIEKYTNNLMNGTFGNHCSISPEFLNQHKISKSALFDKYTKDDLLDAIYEMAKTFQEGYYPENKDSISKRSFANLIYCGRTHISYLLKYLCKDAQPLSYKTVECWDDWIDKLYKDRFFDKEIENDNHQFGILKKGLFGIEEYYNWMEKENLHSKYRIKDEHDLFNWYVIWINERDSVQGNPYNIGPQNNNWYQFIKWLEEAIHGDYVSQFPTLDKRKY